MRRPPKARVIMAALLRPVQQSPRTSGMTIGSVSHTLHCFCIDLCLIHDRSARFFFFFFALLILIFLPRLLFVLSSPSILLT